MTFEGVGGRGCWSGFLGRGAWLDARAREGQEGDKNERDDGQGAGHDVFLGSVTRVDAGQTG